MSDPTGLALASGLANACSSAVRLWVHETRRSFNQARSKQMTSMSSVSSPATDPATQGLDDGHETVGEMEQGDYFKAVGDLLLQTLRNGDKKTRDRAGGGAEGGGGGEAGAGEALGVGGDGGGGGGASILDMVVAMADAGQQRFDSAINKVKGLSAEATQKEFTLATAEIQVAGAAQNAVTQAVASVLDAANKAAKNSA
jgi:hypothetical protein